MKRTARASYISHGYGGQDQEDRLSALPDVLLVYIFSYIDTKLAVQSSILSKRWVNLWTLLPVLNFDSSLFKEQQNYTLGNFRSPTFDIFINNVLAFRNQSIKIDNLNIKVTDHKTMTRVLKYALSHRIPNLSIDTCKNLNKYHTVSCENKCDSCVDSCYSLRSLTLKGMLNFGRFPDFVGLVTLRLERVKIFETLSFPNLESLFLVNCKMSPDSRALKVICPQLSTLMISSCFYQPIPYEEIVLLTPKLVLFELEGLIPMAFEADELPLLDTIHIDCCFSFSRSPDRNVHHPDDNQHLIKILGCLGNAKSVHLSPSTVELLSSSPNMLMGEPCPFGSLKLLNLIPPPNKQVRLHSAVASYLLKDCPQAAVTASPR